MTTELYTFFRGRIRRAFLFLVPLATAVTVGAFLHQQPSSHEATTELLIPPDSASSFGTAALYVANFQVALHAKEIIDGLATETGISNEDISNNLKLVRVGQSSLMQVSFSSESGQKAAAVSQLASRKVAERLARYELDEATNAATSMNSQYRAATNAVDDFFDKNGGVDPNIAYQALQQARKDAPKTGAAAKKEQSDIQAQRDLVREYESLQAAVSAAQTQRNDAQRRLVNVRSAVDRTSADSFAKVVSIHESSPIRFIAQMSILSAGLAAIAVAALLFLIDSRKIRSRSKKRQEEIAVDIRELKADVDITPGT